MVGSGATGGGGASGGMATGVSAATMGALPVRHSTGVTCPIASGAPGWSRPVLVVAPLRRRPMLRTWRPGLHDGRSCWARVRWAVAERRRSRAGSFPSRAGEPCDAAVKKLTSPGKWVVKQMARKAASAPHEAATLRHGRPHVDRCRAYPLATMRHPCAMIRSIQQRRSYVTIVHSVRDASGSADQPPGASRARCTSIVAAATAAPCPQPPGCHCTNDCCEAAPPRSGSKAAL